MNIAPPTNVGHALLLSSTRRRCQELWNNVHITADQKRKATAYFNAHGDDAHKLYALNKRMGELITACTPRHQRPGFIE